MTEDDVKGNLNAFSDELLLEIFKHLGVGDYAHISRVSSFFNSFTNDKQLWAYYLKRDFGRTIDSKFDSSFNCKSIYIDCYNLYKKYSSMKIIENPSILFDLLEHLKDGQKGRALVCSSQ